MIQASLSLAAHGDEIQLSLNCNELGITWSGKCPKSKEDILNDIDNDIRPNSVKKTINSVKETILNGQFAEENGDTAKADECYKNFKSWGETRAFDIFPQRIREAFSKLEEKSQKKGKKVYLSLIFQQNELAIIPIESLYWDNRFFSERFIIGRSLNIGENEDYYAPADLKLEDIPCSSAIIVNPIGDPDVRPYENSVFELFDNLAEGKMLKPLREPEKIGDIYRNDIVRYLIASKFLVFFGHSDNKKGWMVKPETSEIKEKYFSHHDIEGRRISATLIFSYSCHSISLGETFKKGGVEYFPGTFWPIKGSPRNTEFVREFFERLFGSIFEEKPVCEIFWEVANKKVDGQYYYPFIGRSYGFYGSPITPLIDISPIKVLLDILMNKSGRNSLKERLDVFNKLLSHGNTILSLLPVNIFQGILVERGDIQELKKEVLFLIADIGSKKYIEALSDGFAVNPDIEIRKWIIGALGSIEGEGARQELGKIYNDRTLDNELRTDIERFLPQKPPINQLKTKMEELLKGRMLNPGMETAFDLSLKRYILDIPDGHRFLLELAEDKFNEVCGEATIVLGKILKDDELKETYMKAIKNKQADIEKTFRKLIRMGNQPVIDFLLELNEYEIKSDNEDMLVFVIELWGDIPNTSSQLPAVLKVLEEIQNSKTNWIKNLAGSTYEYIIKKKEMTYGNQR